MPNDAYRKYRYPEPIPLRDRQWPDRVITASPSWGSVDLRDGNQALPEPMDPECKLEYFRMLTSIGFKEIEVAFPAASQDDFDFVRKLIGENLIPEGVRIAVLTQARKPLIERTVASLRGASRAILHMYLAASDLHGRFVFGLDREKLIALAREATGWVREAVAKAGLEGKIAYEFSPEEFSDSDLDFAIELGKAVKEAWGPSAKEDFILNLPATVERRPPNQYADMIEYYCRHYPYLNETTISVHAHNDQGCAVAASELAVLAGADRVEGTIFGHGERTGNVDLAVLALNLQSRGIDTGLDFRRLPEIVNTVEAASGIDVHPRHPYAGSLVFTAFSGSHQDAIRKGLESREVIADYFGQGWKIPYLHIDPADVGSEYRNLIRINRQSGKGGIVFILEKEFGIFPPKAMHPEIGRVVQRVLDSIGGEIDSKQLRRVFDDNFVDVAGMYELTGLVSARSEGAEGPVVEVEFTWSIGGAARRLTGRGNGLLSAVKHTLDITEGVPSFILDDFSEKSMGNTADARAMAFVGIRLKEDNRLIYGASTDSDTSGLLGVKALVSALNRVAKG